MVVIVCLEVILNQPTPSGTGHEDQCHWSFLNAEVCVQGDDRTAAWLRHWPRRVETNLPILCIVIICHNLLSLEVGLARNVGYEAKLLERAIERERERMGNPGS